MVNNTLMGNIHPVFRATHSVTINLHSIHFCQVRQIRHRFRMFNHRTLILIIRTTHFNNNVGTIISPHRLPLGPQMQYNRPETQCTPMSHQRSLSPHICPRKPIIIIYNLSTHILTTTHRRHILDIRTTFLRGTSNIRPLLASDIELRSGDVIQ